MQNEKFKVTPLERAWILYDVGNSAFVLMIATLVPIFFNALAEAGGLSSVDYLAYWGYASSVVTVITAVLGPILGTLADTKGFKKPIFMLCLFVGVIGCCAMGVATIWLPFLVIFIIAKIGFSGSLVFYDSMLGDVTTPERMDVVSSQGYAWGYIGSCVPFVVCLGLVLAAGTAGWVVSAGHGADDPEAQWVVVLGAGVNGTVPSQALRERLEAARDYLARYPEAVAVLSGAQGDGESITEARCMYDWLTARGVDPARLRMETKATTTEENLRCSLDLIEAETGTRPAQIAVISGEYHLLRAELLARRAGAEALGVPSYTHDRAFYCLMLAREVCGVWAALLF